MLPTERSGENTVREGDEFSARPGVKRALGFRKFRRWSASKLNRQPGDFHFISRIASVGREREGERGREKGAENGAEVCARIENHLPPSPSRLIETNGLRASAR